MHKYQNFYNKNLHYYLPTINYLLIEKDEEIENNVLYINDLFIKYCKNEITKDYLLDEHTQRNKLFFEWYGMKFIIIDLDFYWLKNK